LKRRKEEANQHAVMRRCNLRAYAPDCLLVPPLSLATQAPQRLMCAR
jgi:hypothetical protein